MGFVQWFEQTLFSPPGLEPLRGDAVLVTSNCFSSVAGEIESGPRTTRYAKSETGAGVEWPYAEGPEAPSHPCSSTPIIDEASLWQGAGLGLIHPLFLIATCPSSLS